MPSAWNKIKQAFDSAEVRADRHNMVFAPEPGQSTALPAPSVQGISQVPIQASANSAWAGMAPIDQEAMAQARLQEYLKKQEQIAAQESQQQEAIPAGYKQYGSR